MNKQENYISNLRVFLESKGINKEEIYEILKPIEKEFNKRICGLVWESQMEDNQKELQESFPSLELKSQLIGNKKEDSLNHILIEGDNLFTLTSLQYTHTINNKNNNKEGLFDIIYIDPPYNLGNKDFKYNDKFVNEDDQWKHSKWLSFMHARLILAKNLLKESGVIFISIDDTEFAQLKLLCDLEEVFDEKNYINTIFVLDKMSGKSGDKFITSVGHKVLVYAKNKKVLNNLGGFNKIENNFGETIEEKFKEHEDGIYDEVSFRFSGNKDKLRQFRPFMYYPILVKNKRIYSITDEEYAKIYDPLNKHFDDLYVKELIKTYENNGFKVILPIDSKNNHVRWKSGFDGFKRLLKENKLKITAGGENINEKKFPTPKELIQQYSNGVAKSFMYKPEYSSGTSDLEKSIGHSCDFSYPKPVSLIMDLISLHPNSNALILDFFAGSGTTAEAVLNLNAIDGGKRQCVLATNNEVDFKSEIKYFSDLGKLNIKISNNGDISKEQEESFYKYKINNKEEYIKIIETEEFQKLGICQSITLKRISNLLDEKSTISQKYIGDNLYYFKLKTSCKNSLLNDVVIKQTVKEFTSYVSIKENCLIVDKSNDCFTIFTNNKDKIVLVFKDLDKFEDEILEECEKILNNYSHKDKIVYSLIDSQFNNHIKFVSYPTEIINTINKVKMGFKSL